jgi:hypothetical protein
LHESRASSSNWRYLVPLEKSGLKVPHEVIEDCWRRISEDFYHHYVVQFFANGFCRYAQLWPSTASEQDTCLPHLAVGKVEARLVVVASFVIL